MQEHNISEQDSNYSQNTRLEKNLRFFNAFQPPFILEGAPFTDEAGVRSRFPYDLAKKMQSSALPNQARQGAGMRVRFRTDSPVVAVKIELAEYFTGTNKAGSAGFDLYRKVDSDMVFLGNHCMEKPVEQWESSWTVFPSGVCEYSLFFPIFCAVKRMEIGLLPDAVAELAAPHRFHDGPVVYYGSSLTTAGYTSRPGLLYTNIIGRLIDTDYINMGFCGGCFGELVAADAIALAKPSLAVVAFDHNSSNAAFLAERHEPFFKYLRSLCPDLPVLLISKLDFSGSSRDEQERRAIIARTWLNAFESGDRLVEFLDGETILTGEVLHWTDMTNDGCHQNDLGQLLAARKIGDRVKRMLLEQERRLK